jgi:hypothetical protein
MSGMNTATLESGQVDSEIDLWNWIDIIEKDFDSDKENLIMILQAIQRNTITFPSRP